MTPADDSKKVQHGSPQGSVQDAVARLFDGDLSEDAFAELHHRLENDAEARREYFECVSLEATLETVFYPPLSRKNQRSLRHAEKSAPSSVIRKTIRWSAGIAAAAAAIALSVMYFTPTEPPSTETRLRVCGNSQWSVNGSANPETNTLTQGAEFQLHQGVAELKLPYEVTAIVEAPATITLINDRTLRLDQGKALFQVPSEKGKGFTVLTPHQRIVDLGTEFGIRFSNKHPDQLELHVLQGEVRIDALENDSNSPDQGTILKKGRSVLLAGTRVLRELDNTQTTFRRKLPEKVDILFQDDFESGLLPEKKYAVRIERYAVRNASGKHFLGIADDTSWHFTTPPSAAITGTSGSGGPFTITSNIAPLGTAAHDDPSPIWGGDLSDGRINDGSWAYNSTNTFHGGTDRANSGDPTRIWITWAQDYEIDKIGLVHADAGAQFYTYDYQLQYLNAAGNPTVDGDWTTIGSIAGNTILYPEYAIDTVTTRGIRLYITDPSTHSGNHVRFSEMLVEGTAVPEPSSAALLGLSGLALILRRRK